MTFTQYELELDLNTPESVEKSEAKSERGNPRSRQVFADVQNMIYQIKIWRGCWNCGYNYNTHALHFAHIEDNKHIAKLSSPTRDRASVNISQMAAWSPNRGTRYAIDTIKAEIAKCIVLCNRCHVELDFPKANTAIENRSKEEHTLMSPAHSKALYQAYMPFYDHFFSLASSY